MKRLLLVCGIVLGWNGPALADHHHGCCAGCGCNQGLRKVCRWVCEEVEEKAPGFACECEDVVVPGKSPFCVQEVCVDPCQDSTPHLFGRLHHKLVWGPPSECCVKTVKVLVRKDKTVKKKVWKPIVETVCDTCCNNCTAGGSPPGVNGGDMPPAIDKRLPDDNPIAPHGESGALMPPMPPGPAGRETSFRRGINSLMSTFAPVNGQR
ncbi:MAG: hypothetical protein WD894_00055 [Pirellulales bacterium]